MHPMLAIIEDRAGKPVATRLLHDYASYGPPSVLVVEGRVYHHQSTRAETGQPVYCPPTKAPRHDTGRRL